MSPLLQKVKETCRKFAATRQDGTVASHRTVEYRFETILPMFALLEEKLNFKLQDPSNIAEKHIKALAQYWFDQGNSPKTIQGKLSSLRIFCGWIGKDGLVKDIYYYLPHAPEEKLKVSTVAKKSKSWAEHGVNIIEKFHEATELDWRFGLMVLAQVSLGLRRNEALQLEPHKCDEETALYAYKTKGGRPRLVFMDANQRRVLDYIKSHLAPHDHLGWPERADGSGKATLKYNQRRYCYYMDRLGITKAVSDVTGHGLRAQFAENAFLFRGLVPPTLGGSKGQVVKTEEEVTRKKVSEALGHSRISVTGAYCGSFGREKPIDLDGRAKKTIEDCLEHLVVDKSSVFTEDQLVHCMHLLKEVTSIGVFECTARQVAALWMQHSRRHASEWLRPSEESNLAALEASALAVMRLKGNDGSPLPA